MCFCYVNQLTMFVPCMVINERRADTSRHAFTCMKTKSKEEMKEEGRSSLFQICCAGRPAKSSQDYENFIQKYSTKFCQFLVGHIAGKVFIALLFLSYLGTSIYGSMNLQQGLELQNLVSETSYLYKFNLWDKLYFGDSTPVSFIYNEPLNYHREEIQEEITSLVLKIKADPQISSYYERNWLDAYHKFPLFNSSSEKAFISGLKQFLKYRPDLVNDITFDSSETSITASRIYFISNQLLSTTDSGDLMESVRTLASGSTLPVFAYTPAFIFYEQYVAIFPATMQTLGISIGVMMVVTAIFMPNVFLVALVTVTLVVILLGIVGFMYFWDLTLSSITMIDLIMTVGFSVDFSAHICHAYMSVTGKTRKEKVQNAIGRSGGPIFNSALSSILGILMLIFSKSYIFLSFFKLMFTVMIFGLFHALWVLPLFLSVMGPMVHSDVGNDKEEKASTDKAEFHQDKMDRLRLEMVEEGVKEDKDSEQKTESGQLSEETQHKEEMETEDPENTVKHTTCIDVKL